MGFSDMERIFMQRIIQFFSQRATYNVIFPDGADFVYDFTSPDDGSDSAGASLTSCAILMLTSVFCAGLGQSLSGAEMYAARFLGRYIRQDWPPASADCRGINFTSPARWQRC